jgi:signal transduction histidine kinase
MMLNSIYSKLGLASLLTLGLQLLFLSFALNLMFDKNSLPTLVLGLVIMAISTAIIFGFIVFVLLSRRLHALSKAVEDFRRSNFTEPVSMTFSNERGDEISRLGFAIEQMQRKISTQIQQSQQIDSHRRELFANVSHDLRTPLTSMRGYLETLLLKTGTIPAKQQRAYLEIALKQAICLGKLINDLFELTKLESDNAAPKLEIFPLSELVQDVIQKFDLIAQEKNVTIESNHTQSAFSTYADISLIDRVFTNLIENAIRHCSPGAVIHLVLGQKENRIIVQVNDTGKGIAPDKLPLIFNRLYRDNADTANGCHSGAGLGLAITKRIIELHGGTIHAESKLGIGTNFQFDLPMGLRASKQLAPKQSQLTSERLQLMPS